MNRTEALQLIIDLSGETTLARIDERTGAREYNFPEMLKDIREAINDQTGSPAPVEDRVVEALSVLTGLPQDWITLPAAAERVPSATTPTPTSDIAADALSRVIGAADNLDPTLPFEAETGYTFTGVELAKLLMEVAGAATSPQYRQHPDEVFPAEDVVMAVQAACIERALAFSVAAERAAKS